MKPVKTMKQEDPFDDFRTWLFVGFFILIPWLIGVGYIAINIMKHIKIVK
jgi:hypothetical protein